MVGSSTNVVDGQVVVEKRKMRGLVVDDDLVIRRVHGMILTKFGVEIDSVDNGKKAVELFASGKSYDIVLMDMEMPIMDGQKATKELREMGVSSTIIGVTACPEAKKGAFLKAGLDACWEKPLKTDLVSGLLEELAKKLLIS